LLYVPKMHSKQNPRLLPITRLTGISSRGDVES
jgi:hypothetical protein